MPFSASKADPKLVVDANAVLANAVPAEGFQMITGRNAQFFNLNDLVENPQLFEGRVTQIGRNSMTFACLPQQHCVRVFETPDQNSMLTALVRIV